jgi:hypothetical protein
MTSRSLPTLAIAAIVLAGCASTPQASVPSSSEPIETATASPPPSGAASPTVAPSSLAGSGVRALAFADVVVDRLTVRSAPGVDSPPLLSFCVDAPGGCPPAEIGREYMHTLVYVLDGPTEADGYAWYLVATDREGSTEPEYVGWVASGDAEDAWLVYREAACPEAPVELADVTFTGMSRLTALHCLGGQEITLTGYYTEPAPGEPLTGDCSAEPGWLICTIGTHILRTVEAPWAGDGNHLQLHLHPELGPMPPRPGWVEVTGMFDHPDAAECAAAGAELFCRMGFVVTSARPSEAP